MKTLTLLLAEDDAPLREVLKEALQLEGFEVNAVASAEAALDLAEQHEYDLALFDVVMDGMSGTDAIAMLRRLQPHIGVVLTTAFATVDGAVDAMKKGADEYLTKPFHLPTLAMTLKQVHAKRTPKLPTEERVNDQVFNAMANPVRRVVMHQLKRHHKLKFMDLCRLVEIEDHTKFNFHLRQLVKCGLVEKDEQKLYLLTHKGQEVLARMLV
ncbi:response regulator [Ferrimonas aestuarii]|uniref:Response regulator n=1 Tax=Ferrimonas aestuarii TaxID=2569539 RepID=A0A4U1BPX9_9GAMM|nr:response regulator [Ferrimonas aestuarii]TKB56673.1 response regulator [Ferrimonas aestuarii]